MTSAVRGRRTLDSATETEEETMGRLTCQITMSLDGYVAGPEQTLEEPLGANGEQLHEWVTALPAWRTDHGTDPGAAAGDPVDAQVYEESVASAGAYVMGRRMFSGGSGPWEGDPNAGGWWGDDPPFHVPVFVLTHHPRETAVMQGGTTFTFVTDGIESALEQARAAAGDRSVAIAGGAQVLQQYLRAGLVDELEVHVAPLLLGGGVRLLEDLGSTPPRLELDRVLGSSRVAHLRFRVARP
jgi:dihydrofolate reductase